MKLAILVVALGACTEDIASGAYLCGPEGLCPDDMVCNGGAGTIDQPGNVCVFPANQEAFSCGELADPPGDDEPAQGRALQNLGCVSGVLEAKGCLLAGDVGDWFQFDVPTNCIAVQVVARLTFSVAFEPVALQFSTNGEAAIPADTGCSPAQAPSPGEAAVCFKQTLANGAHHAFGLVHTGVENCDGTCPNNRYKLLVQLSTP
ncbi:MAG: hypothetical protein ABI867_08275 [Kofleriaceae bacterium]